MPISREKEHQDKLQNTSRTKQTLSNKTLLPVTFKEAFSYSETSEETHFGFKPTTKPNIAKLIANQAYWPKPQAKKNQKQTLVLNDWTASNWSVEKITSVQKILGELLDDGFTIYLWQQGKLEQLNKNNISSIKQYYIRSRMTPAYEDELQEVAFTKYGLSNNQTRIIDDCWLNRLLIQNINLPRQLLTSDLIEKSAYEKDKLIEILKKAEPPLSVVVCDTYSEKANRLSVKLKKVYPNIVHIDSYREINLSKEHWENLALNKKVTLGGVSKTFDDFKWDKIKKIAVMSTGEINTILFRNILKKGTQLTSVDLSDLENINKVISTLEPGSLSCLTKIDLSGTDINGNGLATLLKASLNLTFLSLSDCESLNEGKLELEPGSLTEIDLSYATINSNSLATLLKAAPNVTSIDLCDCENLNEGKLELEPGSLSSLNNIDLNDTNINSSALTIILQAAPNITSISLSGCKNINDAISKLKPEGLTNLSNIHLATSDINSNGLCALLKAAPKLKSISLHCCEDMNKGKLKLEPKSLTNLTAMYLNSNNIHHDRLCALLKAAPNVSSIDLSKCKNINKAISNLETGSLTNLTNIDLHSTDINEVALNALLKAAPNVSSIDLSKCKNINKAISNLETGSLTNLTNINLNSTDINEVGLCALLKAAPKLTSITLSGCNNINKGKLALQPGSLPNLTEIHLSGGDINRKNLSVLLKAAPNARPIGIYNNLRETVSNNRTETPPHRANDMREFVPSNPEAEFIFKGNNKTKNQGMIIEKLSQYLTIKQKHLAAIPRMQDGICNALSHFFKDHSEKQWHEFMNAIVTWNGQKSTLTKDLGLIFDTLFGDYVKPYQLGMYFGQTGHYLGDNLGKLIPQTKKTFILSNPWHAIVIRPKENNHNLWLVYDPNYVGGVKEVASNKLVTTIKDRLGSLVSTKLNIKILPKINNPGEFIENGGLLALCSNDNSKSMIRALPTRVDNFSKNNLDGLFLRTTKGSPAWLAGLESSNQAIVQYAKQLLLAFIQKNPKDYTDQLSKSLAALNDKKRHEAITKVIQLFPTSSQKSSTLTNVSIRKILINAVKKAPVMENQYEEKFKTWRKRQVLTNDPKEYCQQITSTDKQKKRLIKCSSNNDITSMQLILQKYCKSTHRPAYTIDSPDDLVCSAPFVKREQKNTGTLTQGPGGPLHDFLIKDHQGADPVLMINYNNFEPDDIVRFNALLDDKRLADGTPLPDCVSVVGLINPNKPGVYQGADFYSRFNKVEQCPLPSDTLDKATKEIPFLDVEQEVDTSVYKIDLYHGTDWKERLLGSWQLDEDRLTYVDGELVKALRNNYTVIEIGHGLWDNQKFVDFWKKACHLGYIESAGLRIAIPKKLKIIKTLRYDFDFLKDNLSNKGQINSLSDLPSKIKVLNPSNFDQLFGNFQCVKNCLIKQPGLIQDSENTVLPLYLTREISIDAWAKIQAECIKHKVRLALYLAPGVELSEQLELRKKVVKNSRKPKEQKLNYHTQVILSHDMDTSVAKLTSNNNKANWLVIDVSEMQSDDLLTQVDGKLNPKSLKFEFSKKEQPLFKALNAGKKVILKGRFSEMLEDSLVELMINRQTKENVAGQLVVIQSDEYQFSAFTNREKDKISKQEKIKWLTKFGYNKNIIAKIDDFIEVESLSKLRARADYLKAHPNSNDSDQAWRGMSTLTTTNKLPKHVAFKNSKTISEKFHQKRREAVNKVLNEAPYAFITGLSGIGKSTFVEKELCRENENLYIGETNLKAWATDKTPGRRILFIDEANLSHRQWSEFEGLYNTPPSITTDGEVHLLNQEKVEYKVVFAGNPVDYGDARHLANFFARHGNSVVFEPLPQEVIYEAVLKPVFANMDLKEAKQIVISQQILDAYRFICQLSTNKVLISPRELQMMALMTMSFVKHSPKTDIEKVARHFVYEIGKGLIPPNNYATFATQFKPEQELKQKDINIPDFCVTHSRKPLLNQLNNLINLRSLRQSANVAAQKYGGLGGLVLEGSPGIGKSQLVIKFLIENGFEQEHDYNNETAKKKPFYLMPVSMSVEDKKNLLLKAFDEGAIVIVDEINSSPMMERLLNSLLMGKKPLQEGEHPQTARPKKAGFMIIGTQNPPIMAGRRNPSNALARRMLKFELEEYQPDEMILILKNSGLPQTKGKVLVDAYTKQLNHARKNHLQPEPTFRDLLDVANNIIRSKKTLEKIEMKSNNRKDKNQKRLEEKVFVIDKRQRKNEQVYKGLNNEIDAILNRFRSDIDNIPYFKEIKAKAILLLDKLERYKKIAFQNPNTESINAFSKKSKEVIKKVTPIFKRSLKWERYLRNLEELSDSLTRATVYMSTIEKSSHLGLFSTKPSFETEKPQDIEVNCNL